MIDTLVVEVVGTKLVFCVKCECVGWLWVYSTLKLISVLFHLFIPGSLYRLIFLVYFLFDICYVVITYFIIYNYLENSFLGHIQ